METICFTKNQFARLKRYIVPSDISNSECNLYVMPNKNKEYDYMIKIYNDVDCIDFGSKLNVINNLMKNKNSLSEDLVLPEKLVIVEDKVCGYAMPFINNNTNLLHILNNIKINNEFKMECLNGVLNILSSLKYNDKNIGDIFIGDLHGGNFIYNLETKKINSIDTDSYSINNIIQHCYPVKFQMENFCGLDKYQFNEYGLLMPNSDSDAMLFVYLIMNTIANYDINKLNLNEFYNYIYYLRNCGYSKEVLDCFCNIYTNNPNYIYKEILNQIDLSGITNYNIYRYNLNKKH